MVEYEELINRIHDWAHQRKIDQADPRVEFMKMAEELGELSAAYNKQNHERVVESIAAYREIADRQGETTSAGVFIKQSDLEKKN